MFRYGIIVKVSDGTEEGYPLGWCRVKFPHYDVVSKWIPQLVFYSKDDKELSPLAINTHVVCLMDEFCEDGCVLGAFYTTKDTTPEGAGSGKWVKEYKDGSLESYDNVAHLRKIKVGNITLEMDRNVVKFNGGNKGGIPEKDKVKANDDSIKTYVTGLVAAITAALTTVDASAGSASSGAFSSAMAALSMTVTDVANDKVKI